MKKFKFLIGFVFGLMLVSCISTETNYTNEVEEQISDFAEMDASYFSWYQAHKKGWKTIVLYNCSWESYNNNDKTLDCIINTLGDKITFWSYPVENMVQAIKDVKKEEQDKAINEFLISDGPKIFKDNPDIIDLVKYKNKGYTFKLTLNEDSYITNKAELVSIENLNSIRQEVAKIKMEKIKDEEAKIAKEKEESEKKAYLDNQGKQIAKGYTYHGISEADSNNKKLRNGTLEPDHAYYITNWVVNKYTNDMGSVIISVLEASDPIMVKYLNNQVKDDVLNTGITMFGNIPISIIVAGSSDILKRPVILGVIK